MPILVMDIPTVVFIVPRVAPSFVAELPPFAITLVVLPMITLVIGRTLSAHATYVALLIILLVEDRPYHSAWAC